jgi:hypothetical protein
MAVLRGSEKFNLHGIKVGLRTHTRIRRKTVMKRTALRFIPVLIVFLFVGFALAQDPIIYPAKGQSPDQQKQDEFECHQRAVNQTANIQQYNRAKAVCKERRGYTVK